MVGLGSSSILPIPHPDWIERLTYEDDSRASRRPACNERHRSGVREVKSGAMGDSEGRWNVNPLDFTLVAFSDALTRLRGARKAGEL